MAEFTKVVIGGAITALVIAGHLVAKSYHTVLVALIQLTGQAAPITGTPAATTVEDEEPDARRTAGIAAAATTRVTSVAMRIMDGRF